MNASVVALAIALMIVTLGATRQAIAYSFLSIDYPGANFTQAFGLNDRGDVVGSAGPLPAPGQPLRNEFGFVLSGGTFAAFTVPGGTDPGTAAYGINNERQIVGFFGSHR